MPSFYQEITISTEQSFDVIDITKHVNAVVQDAGIKEGILTISSLHTTCALSVNENEERLVDDIRNFFLSIAPPERPYKHNDLHLRAGIPPDEPENAHSHLIAMMVGNGEVVSIHEGKLVLGQYQSVLLLELDGPRNRKLAVQIIG